MRFHTLTALEQARSKLIQRAVRAKHAGNAQIKADAQGRAEYLSTMIEELRISNSGGPLPPRVFISFAKETGADYADQVGRRITTRFDFEVRTGFDPDPKGETHLLTRVLNRLNDVSMFVGILTRHHQISSDHGMKYAPSVWTIEEKGMALAMRHSVVLLVEDGVHPDYWQRTTPEDMHFVFAKGSFAAKADEALEALNTKYKMRFELYLKDS